MFDGADRPFSAPVFDAPRKLVAESIKMAEQVARLPLDACDAPGKGDNATGVFDGL